MHIDDGGLLNGLALLSLESCLYQGTISYTDTVIDFNCSSL